MKRIVVYPEELQLIFDRLDRIEASLNAKQKQPDDPFLDSQEFIQLMNISKRTAQAWRDQGIIPYSQVGSKIYYRMSDIQKLLDAHYQNFKQQKA